MKSKLCHEENPDAAVNDLDCCENIFQYFNKSAFKLMNGYAIFKIKH